MGLDLPFYVNILGTLCRRLNVCYKVIVPFMSGWGLLLCTCHLLLGKRL